MEGEGRYGVGEGRFAFVGASPETRRSTAGNLAGGGGVAPVTFGPRVVPPTIGRNNPRVLQGYPTTRPPLKS